MKKKLANIDDSVKRAVIIVLVVALLMAIMYFLTTKILEKEANKNNEPAEAVIQYDEILAGSSFNMKDSEYLVVYYDFSGDDTIASAVSAYQSKSDVTRLYSVDLSNGMNKSYLTEEEINTSSITDLKVKNNTMLRIKDGKVEEEFTTREEIEEYLAK